jgi:hypothetical protein
MSIFCLLGLVCGLRHLGMLYHTKIYPEHNPEDDTTHMRNSYSGLKWFRATLTGLALRRLGAQRPPANNRQFDPARAVFGANLLGLRLVAIAPIACGAVRS